MSETWTSTTPVASQVERNTARPASKAITSASGARMLDSCSTTDVGSTPPSFATSASQRVPERERIPGVQAAVLELVDRAHGERAELVELPHAPEMEERVAVHDSLDAPEGDAETDARERDEAAPAECTRVQPLPRRRAQRERQRDRAGAENEGERQIERAVNRERERERRRDESARPGERCRKRPTARARVRRAVPAGAARASRPRAGARGPRLPPARAEQ